MKKIFRILIAMGSCLVMMFLTVVILVLLNLKSNFILAFVTLTTFSITYKLLPKTKKELEIKNAAIEEILHENGIMKETGKLLHGKRIGEWSVFDEQGAYIRTDYYEDGILVATRRTE